MVLRNEQLIEAVFWLHKRRHACEKLELLPWHLYVRECLGISSEHGLNFVNQDSKRMLWIAIQLPLSQVQYILWDVVIGVFARGRKLGIAAPWHEYGPPSHISKLGIHLINFSNCWSKLI